MRKLAYIFGIALFLFGCAKGYYQKTSRDIIIENEQRILKNPNVVLIVGKVD